MTPMNWSVSNEYIFEYNNCIKFAFLSLKPEFWMKSFFVSSVNIDLLSLYSVE